MDLTGIILIVGGVVIVGILGMGLLFVLITVGILGAGASLAVKGVRAIHSGSVSAPLFSLVRPAKPQPAPKPHPASRLAKAAPSPRSGRYHSQPVNPQPAPQTMIGRVLAAEAAYAAAVDSDPTPEPRANLVWPPSGNSSFFDPADWDRDGVIDI